MALQPEQVSLIALCALLVILMMTWAVAGFYGTLAALLGAFIGVFYVHLKIALHHKYSRRRREQQRRRPK